MIQEGMPFLLAVYAFLIIFSGAVVNRLTDKEIKATMMLIVQITVAGALWFLLPMIL